MRHSSAKPVALGGLMAALSMVIMCLGGMIPVATYVCPVLCMFLGAVVLRMCKLRIAWAWYGAVSILALLLGPDKEAAAIYLCLGYYPIVKPWFDRLPLRWVWKLLLFNCVILALYSAMIYLLGMDALAKEFAGLGLVGLCVILVLGNFTFLLLDKLLSRFGSMGRRKHGCKAMGCIYSGMR